MNTETWIFLWVAMAPLLVALAIELVKLARASIEARKHEASSSPRPD